MAYATVADVQAAMPDGEDPIPNPPPASLVTGLEEATDLVIGYLEREFTGELLGPPDDLVPEDVPGAVRRVVARVALRAFLDDPMNPGAESEVNLMGPFSHTINWSKEATARDFYLTRSDEIRLDRFKSGYTGGVAHMPMSGAGDFCHGA